MGKSSDDEEKEGKPKPRPNRPRGLPGFGAGNPRATLKAAAASLSLGKKPEALSEAQKALLKSSFNSGKERERLRTRLPGVWDANPLESFTLTPPADLVFDGKAPAADVTSRDVWKAIQPPVQSRENCRSGLLYAQVINQFAAGANPRYQPEDAEGSRAHIFVWDVTRAMGAEIPHMLGARQLNLQQMVDWLRFEASDRGWMNIGAVKRALELAAQGKPVVVIPKDLRVRPASMAVVRPEPPGADGIPRVASASPGCGGSDVSAAQALGVNRFDFFGHS